MRIIFIGLSLALAACGGSMLQKAYDLHYAEAVAASLPAFEARLKASRTFRVCVMDIVDSYLDVCAEADDQAECVLKSIEKCAD